MNRLLIAVVSLAVVLGCSPSSTTSNSQSSGSGGSLALKPEAIAQIEALLKEKAARTPAQAKVSSALLYAKSGRFNIAGKSKTEQLRPLWDVDATGRILIDVKGDVSPELISRIEGLGGTVVTSAVTHRSVRAWIQLDRVEDLAGESTVHAIRPGFLASTARANGPRSGAKFSNTTRADRVTAVQKMVQNALVVPRSSGLAGGATTNAGAAESQGDKAHGAERARKFFNVDGTGVRIGVLSDSDDLKENSIASGDLPADTVTVPGQDGRPGSGEGTAMMEIVHDLAPGAKLFFATAFNSPESFADNIRTLRFTYHCDIIVDDVIYFFESPFEDDIIAQAVEDVTSDGAMYFSSAGNGGNRDDGTSGTWEGDFEPGGTLATLPSGYTVHDFGHGVISNRIELSGGPLILHWSDPGSLDNPASANDYDLFILDSDLRNVLVASTDIQDGTGLPFEFLGYFVPANLQVVVAKHPGAKTRAIRTVLFGGEFALATTGSTYGHNSAPGAIGVAAVDVAEAVGGVFTAGPTTPVELYSSDGYRRIFYDRNNRRISGGVTFASGGGETRRNPQLTGADGVSTTLPSFSGLNPFFGTSAAAPHAAAIAGLLKSAVPRASASKIKRSLINTALDIEQDGYDRNSGAGIVSALAALQDVGATPAVFLDLGTVTTTASGGGNVLPGGSGQISVQLINNGGAIAKGVSATLSSSSTGVTITQAGSSYPNLAAGASATNGTPFTFSLDSAAPCGAKLSFTLTVTFSGRGTSPTVFNFSVQTGNPSATATNFAYGGAAVPIPDDDPAGVNVPLTIAGAGPASKVVFRIDGTACSADIGSTTVGVDHTFASDLIFSLTSPSGTTVRLINEVGGGGNNFCQTVLDDAATSSINDVLSTDAPFTGTFSPSSPESVFFGESADGTWVLNVSDNFAIDTGNVRAFSMDVSGFSCTP